MGSFTATSGADTFSLDTAGNVTESGNPAGTWTTNQQNQLVITKPDGTIVVINATWRFNNQNQLTLQPAGQGAAFNFASDPALRNSFTTVNAALQVMPEKAGSFQFTLHGDWNLDANHDMQFTVGGVQSTINGFVSDPIGRFIFHFADGQSPLRTNVLGFVGSWDLPRDANNQPIKSGDAILVFHYTKEDGSTGTLPLPQSAAINRSTNQLSYTYQKGNKTLSIAFQGTLMIDPDFQITYIFNRQVSSSGDQMVASTTIGFDAMLTKPDFSGDLQLSLTKPDGSAGTTLTIGGNFQGVLGKTKLLVGFSFQQSFGPSGTLSRTANFDGDLTFSGGEVQWTFQATGQTVALATTVDVKLGPVSADARLNLTMDNGQVSGVTFLLGISF
jgi:hypothetical protein